MRPSAYSIARSTLEREGVPHDVVASPMIAALSDHDLLAWAPSWDGKWLSALLRSAGHPRHTLRLRDTAEASREVVTALLSRAVPTNALVAEVAGVIVPAAAREQRAILAHRALADACVERERGSLCAMRRPIADAGWLIETRLDRRHFAKTLKRRGRAAAIKPFLT